MYHAIVLRSSLSDYSTLEDQYLPFAYVKSENGSQNILALEVKPSEKDQFISKLQKEIKAGPYYAHLYNDSELIVVFKEKSFVVANPDEIIPVWEYARSLNIPEEQLDFQPASFAEEEDYFNT
ncbi:MAG: hypothetical protein QY330_03345 [Candidatus Dojkabacteria bacterium]|uniref:Uncharacterized protein n=2 Tax=Candidatus Dojkabacteria TaxID=74243 RepID=A0A136KFZ8_9BACT|nr:MAG: hypothetical protein UZ20_WS6002000796 [candidate division WS6 bacterium OLB21]MBW7953349.1 hypothetical protein [Candidatus Dojkabacteria bacterium]WKZ27555.1 MAG: hypothetical protein QY330_03345 [Candidatus Dojkabacteria bacterium]